MNKKTPTVIVWFRRDLRLSDHPALTAACTEAGTVIPVFIWAPEEEGVWKPGAASRWWLHQSLASLQTDLADRRSRLIIRKGNTLEVLLELSGETGARHIYWNRCYEPALRRRDLELEDTLRQRGLRVETFHDGLLFEPHQVRNLSGKPYKVFTPFWNAAIQKTIPDQVLSVPENLKAPLHWLASSPLIGLKLEPLIPWAEGFRKMWRPGRAGARVKWRAFKDEKVFYYETRRNHPRDSGTSRLSPHLHFGEISVREVWNGIKKNRRTLPYLRQLVWREFALHLLYHFPHTPEKPLDPKFIKFNWKKNGALLKAWQKGRTGYPIVDAGMRELWQTGWMHNRVRMIAASFLVKDLFIAWQTGAKWFWDTLVDADLANNTMGWQWVAGCGADAAPFFRIFNPVRQGEKFDPAGAYVKRWVPELAGLPAQYIHKPWQAPAEILKAASVKLGTDYPKPVVDHDLARRQALYRYERIKK